MSTRPRTTPLTLQEVALKYPFMPEGWYPTPEQVEPLSRGILPQPGQRHGVTGGLLPFQGDPVAGQQTPLDPYSAGQRDRQQAADYYAGLTGRPQLSMEGRVPSFANPNVIRPPAPAVRPPSFVHIGERDPNARQPGKGQGVIRRGNQVFAYSGGAQLLNANGTPRVFASEEEAYNALNPPPAAPAAANPTSVPSPAPAVPSVASMPSPAPRPAVTKPVSAPVAPATMPNTTFQDYGLAGVIGKAALHGFKSAVETTAQTVPAATSAAVSTLVGGKGLSALTVGPAHFNPFFPDSLNDAIHRSSARPGQSVGLPLPAEVSAARGTSFPGPLDVFRSGRRSANLPPIEEPSSPSFAGSSSMPSDPRGLPSSMNVFAQRNGNSPSSGLDAPFAPGYFAGTIDTSLASPQTPSVDAELKRKRLPIIFEGPREAARFNPFVMQAPQMVRRSRPTPLSE